MPPTAKNILFDQITEYIVLKLSAVDRVQLMPSGEVNEYGMPTAAYCVPDQATEVR